MHRTHTSVGFKVHRLTHTEDLRQLWGVNLLVNYGLATVCNETNSRDFSLVTVEVGGMQQIKIFEARWALPFGVTVSVAAQEASPALLAALQEYCPACSE